MIGSRQFRDAAHWMGSRGKASIADRKLYHTRSSDPTGMVDAANQRQATANIISRGKRRMAWGGGLAGGGMVLNGLRGPGDSSGSAGMMPHSSGGMAGTY